MSHPIAAAHRVLLPRSSSCMIAAVVSALVLAAPAPADSRHPTAEESPMVAEAEALLADLEEHRGKYRDLSAEIATLEGEEREVVALQMRKVLFEFMRSVEKLVANVTQQTEAKIDAAGFRQRTRKLLWNLDRSIPEFIDSALAEASELRASREGSEPEAVVKLDKRIDRLESVTDEIFRFYRSHIGHLEAMGLGSVNARALAGERLTERAGLLTGRLQLARTQRDEAQKESEAAPEDSALEAPLRAAQEHLDAVAASLWTTCDVMDDLDLPTADYRKELITATGEITTDVLDFEIVGGLLEDAGEGLRRWLEQRGPAVFGRAGMFIAILVFFWLVGGVARRIVARVIGESRENLSELARRMIISFTSRIIVMIGFFFALSQIGVNVTALLAGLGIVGFIVGFALQDTLSNFASGAMILAYRPFDVGDVIEASGVKGTVDNMNLVSTTILTFDNQTLVVPNSKIWGDVIRNVTSQRIRRVDLEFPLAHGVDVARAEEIFQEICAGYPTVLPDPEVAIRVHDVTASAVVFIVRPWVKTEDYWPTFWDMSREATVRLAAAGITMGASRHIVQIEGQSANR